MATKGAGKDIDHPDATRLQQIERLYHAALERHAEERSAYLTSACGDDEPLRLELESLFQHEPSARNFMESAGSSLHSPRAGILQREMRRAEEERVPGRLAGRTFGVYELKVLIASGGMGEVYRAIDTRLNRPVAV
ncbi:MAG TPA: hypothetical protein VLL05_13795, partial [Terriglobales bacterium]|nr:hypothetical protein [Terriglobales bacterium]